VLPIENRLDQDMEVKKVKNYEKGTITQKKN
jgi:hypothetical protein